MNRKYEVVEIANFGIMILRHVGRQFKYDGSASNLDCFAGVIDVQVKKIEDLLMTWNRCKNYDSCNALLVSVSSILSAFLHATKASPPPQVPECYDPQEREIAFLAMVLLREMPVILESAKTDYA